MSFQWGDFDVEQARYDKAEAARLDVEIQALQARRNQLLERAHLIEQAYARPTILIGGGDTGKTTSEAAHQF